MGAMILALGLYDDVEVSVAPDGVWAPAWMTAMGNPWTTVSAG